MMVKKSVLKNLDGVVVERPKRSLIGWFVTIFTPWLVAFLSDKARGTNHSTKSPPNVQCAPNKNAETGPQALPQPHIRLHQPQLNEMESMVVLYTLAHDKN